MIAGVPATYGKMREGWEDDDKVMVSDVEGVQSLDGREKFRSMRDGVFVCVCVVVVAIGWLWW